MINVALPAAAISSVHNVEMHPDSWLAATTPWIGVALAIAVIVPLCRTIPSPEVAMLEMAMPPMPGASIMAIDHDLEPDLLALAIGIGIALSMLTAWLWWSVIAAL